MIGRLDEQADGTSMVHRLNPLSKLLITIAYIGITTSYDKYNLSGLIIMIVFPAIWYQFAGLLFRECFYRMRYVMPLVIIMALPNPFMDKAPMLFAGSFVISRGVLSMITLVIKGILCLMMSYILIATTSVEEICKALRRIHVPAFFTTLILLTFRFITILLDEVSIMTDAYKLRAPGQNGIAFKAWGSFLGQLIIRSSDRAQNLYESMVLRGYKGDIEYLGRKKYYKYSGLIAAITLLCMIAVRYVNIAELFGQMVMR